MYNLLIQNIGERDKKCLSLFNICLRIWMDRLSEDLYGSLWSDISPLDFDKWLDDATKKKINTHYQSKTS